jgi:hypothetical protein
MATVALASTVPVVPETAEIVTVPPVALNRYKLAAHGCGLPLTGTAVPKKPSEGCAPSVTTSMACWPKATFVASWDTVVPAIADQPERLASKPGLVHQFSM